MTDQQLIKINVEELQPEEARVLGIELLEGDIDKDKAAVKRNALISAVLTAGMIVTGMNNIPSYAIMGADSVFVFQLFEKVQALFKKKKQLKQFENHTYDGSYTNFIKECQSFVEKKYKYLKDPEEYMKK